ncbi:type II secretion system major pseudopilin GspG [Pyruvatibacter mobilis]|uniref:type II secretion system major pseudopilin GspG n=1 Tax=Pyruvatibacter mobilis TaxID=1712261 RepID=UPI00040FB2F8
MAGLVRFVRARREPPLDKVERAPADAGFTLLELLVTLAIIGLIAGLAGPPVVRYLAGARSDTAQTQARNLATAVELLRLDVGRYPTEEEGLSALSSAPADMPQWRGPYIQREGALLDPWGQPYRYRAPGTSGAFDVFSYGADNKPGGEGEDKDIVDN